MKPIQILGIAPYEGMASLMRQAAKKRPDVELSVFVGDLSAGVQLAESHIREANYDVILSRGGTAELIREQTSLHVIDIPLSVYDILRSIKLAENHNCRYAIIGFPAITKNATFLCEVLRYDVDIYTIHNEDEARSILHTLKEQGCQMLLCDMVTNSLAQEYNIPAILITSGIESVESALDLAIQEGNAHRRAVMQAEFFRSIVQALPLDTVVYDKNGDLAFQAVSSRLPANVEEKLKHIAICEDEALPRKSYVESDSHRYSIRVSAVTVNEETYHVASIKTSRLPCSLQKYGITWTDRQEASDTFFDSFYGITEPFSASHFTLEQYLKSSQPLVIFGEPGTAKMQIAQMIYTKSPLSSYPMVTINCGKLVPSGWNYLMENDQSPLLESNATICFDHITSLTDAQFDELFSTVRDLGTHKRNRLLFMASCSNGKEMNPRYPRLVDMLNCLTLFMPPLRSHLEDIPRLASLYISTLNMQVARAVIGFEPEAALKMKDYTWPGNYDQFHRVLDELVMITDTPYISTRNVEKILAREQLLYPPADTGSDTIPSNLTLEQVDMLVIQRVLAEEKGNQKRTAERLGISRTTLWHMLQKMPKDFSET